MNEYWKAIVLQEIKEQFSTEEEFYSRHLGMDEMEWIRWRKNDVELGKHAIEKIHRLFTDYEKMIVQKVVRNAEIIPAIQMNPVREYKQMKFHIARRWIQSGLAEAEWLGSDTSADVDEEHFYQTDVLRVEADYGFWSYKDRLEFRIRRFPKKEIRWTKPELLEWFSQKIDEHTEEGSRS